MLKFALLGYGRIAKKHAELLGRNRIREAILAAVCDVKEDRARRYGEAFGVPWFTDMHAMMKTLGSGCGNILFLLGQSLPGSRITGIEINPLAVILGNTWLREEGVTNVQLKEGRAEQLDTIPDKSFDVVFSCASLMYVMPAHIEQVLLNMARITRRTVILIEMHGDLSLKYLGEFHLPNNWKRNYRRIFENLGISDDRIHIEPVPSHLWQPGGGGASYIEVRIA